ncbi:hypothetical protein BD309DRAFT_958478 [Dichomitus squalens]|nr:hypothetical protein BD309DRAFT_958478 [Dichomitus squalens]
MSDVYRYNPTLSHYGQTQAKRWPRARAPLPPALCTIPYIHTLGHCARDGECECECYAAVGEFGMFWNVGRRGAAAAAAAVVIFLCLGFGRACSISCLLRVTAIVALFLLIAHTSARLGSIHMHVARTIDGDGTSASVLRGVRGLLASRKCQRGATEAERVSPYPRAPVWMEVNTNVRMFECAKARDG